MGQLIQSKYKKSVMIAQYLVDAIMSHDGGLHVSMGHIGVCVTV